MSKKIHTEVTPNHLTIKEFSAKANIGLTVARELANSKIFCDLGISVDARTPGKKNRKIRIIWERYQEYVGKRPAVEEHVKPRLRVI